MDARSRLRALLAQGGAHIDADTLSELLSEISPPALDAASADLPAPANPKQIPVTLPGGVRYIIEAPGQPIQQLQITRDGRNGIRMEYEDGTQVEVLSDGENFFISSNRTIVHDSADDKIRLVKND